MIVRSPFLKRLDEVKYLEESGLIYREEKLMWEASHR